MNLKEIAKQIVEQGELANAMQEALFYHTVNGRLTAEALIKYVSQFEKQAQKLAPNAPVRRAVCDLSGYYKDQDDFYERLCDILKNHGLWHEFKEEYQLTETTIRHHTLLLDDRQTPIRNSMLVIKFYQLESGKWEVVCYLS